MIVALLSSFFPYSQYHIDGNRAQFYIDDSVTANALLKVSRKITDKDGYKVVFSIYLLNVLS